MDEIRILRNWCAQGCFKDLDVTHFLVDWSEKTRLLFKKRNGAYRAQKNMTVYFAFLQQLKNLPIAHVMRIKWLWRILVVDE